VQRLQFDLADGERVAVVEQPHVVFLLGPLVAPVGAAFARAVDRRVVALGQLARAAEEVGVDVRLGHGGDGEVVRLREGDVAVHVALRVDEERLAGVGAADEVGVLRELRVENGAQEHGGGRKAGGHPVVQERAGGRRRFFAVGGGVLRVRRGFLSGTTCRAPTFSYTAVFFGR